MDSMRISTKGRYALRMLLDLAEHKDDGFISLKEIAQRQNISKQYLEQIVAILHTSNFLRANRGKQGGYMLAKNPSQCTVGQILRVTEGSLAPIACLEDEVNQCDRVMFCKTLPMWRGLNKVITDYLESVTLQDMMEQYQEQSADHYVI
jgi:Rrf2 family protein